MGLIDKAKQLLGQHDDKVDEALGKAGEAAKSRFGGNDAMIDQGVDHLRRTTGEGDTTQAPPPAAPPPAEGGETPPPRQQ